MPSNRLEPLKNAVLASATRKLHLGVLGSALTLSFATRWFEFGGELVPNLTLGLGVLAYLALVALDATDADFIRNTQAKLRIDTSAEEFVDAKSLIDPSIRQQYQAILAAFQRCRGIFVGSSHGLQQSLDEGIRRSEKLVLVAGRAAKRGDTIHRHLSADTPAELAQEVERLREQAQRTRDEAARQGFTQAADAKAKELETYQQLEGLRDRVHAQLKLIETSLDGLSAKLVKLDASDLTEAITVNESLDENLRTMTSDVELLESTYEETMQELRL
ncbi:MAG: hypothetical protein QM756_08680 [Polyangiaceae bacterium]